MTASKRFTLSLVGLIIGVTVMLGGAWGGYVIARGDSGSAVTLDAGVPDAAGSGSAVVVVPPDSTIVVAPKDQLKDPFVDPAGAVSDLETAKKKGGWLGLLLLGTYTLLRVLGRLGTKFSSLAFLDKGRAAIVIAGATTVIGGCVDAFLLGGTYITVGIAALYAVIGLLGTGSVLPPKKAA